MDAVARPDRGVRVCMVAREYGYIVQVDGMSDVERILERIAAGNTTEAAVREVLHSDYADLMQSTAQYLRKTYGN